MRGHRQSAGPVAALTLFLAVSAVALGQAAEGEEKPQASVSTFVPDSSVAVERLALADKLAKAGEWAKSAEIYQELLENYRDRVVPASGSDATLYRNVTDRVLQELANWPAEGLAVYNGRYDPAAKTLLADADDANSLRAITDRYLLTRSGLAATGRLLQEWWDQGQTGTAAQFAERVATLLPADHPQRPLLLLQAGLCWHLSGNADRARANLARLREQYPTTTQTIAGQEAILADTLEQALAAPTMPTSTTIANAWRSFGGSPQRSQISAGLGRPDALLFSVDLVSPSRSDNLAGMVPNIPAAALRRQAREDLNQALTIMPVYDGGELFFQDGTNLYGVSLDGGMKLPGWPAVSVAIATTSPASIGPSLRTLAVTDDSVFTVQSDLTSLIQGMPVGPGGQVDNSALTCFDRRTGKLRWRITPPRLAGAAPALKSVQIASAPLVVGSHVFVAARGGRNAQLNDIYVLCFDRADGRLAWSSYVASGPSGSLVAFEMYGNQVETGLPQLSWNAGRVIVLTNVGAVAALDADSGLPAWLRLYQRAELPSARMLGRVAIARPSATATSPRIFAASPATVSAGRIFALPADGTGLLVLDESDGRVLKRVPLQSLGNVDTLVGVRGQQVIVAGERVATVFDWQAASEETTEQTDAIKWTMDFPGAALRGRPFLTADSLFLATDDRLLRVASEHWKIEQTMPKSPATWAAEQGPGNLLVTGEHVVVATAKQVNVYTNLASITARYDRDIAADPTSPEPLIRYGELLFTAGHNDMALARFKAALPLARASGAKPELRDRLFSATLSCAQRTSLADPASAASLAYLEIAQSAAQTPAQYVQFHIAAANRAQRANDGPAAMAQMQSILDDPQKRAASVRDIDGTLRLASLIARRTITQLIDRYGTAVYQPAELALQKQLAAAQDARDPSALMELYRRYPNSRMAASAVFAAGRLYEDARRHADAAAAYRTLVQEFPTHPDAPAFFESFARAYAALPGKAHIAAARLSQAAVLLNDPSTRAAIRLPDGQVIEPGPFSRIALAMKQAAGVQSGRTLPDLQLPPAGVAAFAKSESIDLAADRILWTIPGTRPDYRRCVVLTKDQSLIILEPAGKVLARIPATAIVAPVDIAWANPNTLLVRSRTQLVGIDVAAGTIRWTIQPSTLPSLPPLEGDAEPPADPDPSPEARIQIQIPAQQVRIANGALLRQIAGAGAADPDSGEIASLAISGNRAVFGTTSGRLACVNADTGTIAWQAQLGQGSIARVEACDDFAAARLDSPQQSRIAALDMETGQRVFGRTTASSSPIHNLALTGDGRLIFTISSRLVCKDLFDPSDRLLFETGLSENATGFYGQTGPDQLLATDDAIIAVTDGGVNVRLFSPITGRAILPGGAEALGRAALALPPAMRQPGGIPVRQVPTRLVAAEPYIYAYHPAAVRALNLQRSGEPADRMLPGSRPAGATLSPLVPGLMHLVALEGPPRQANPQTVPQIGVYAFSRLQGARSESGRLEHAVTIRHDAGITSSQLVEGGLYLTTGTGQLLYYPATTRQ